MKTTASTPPETIVQVLAIARIQANCANINPRFAHLGPVKYSEWRSWVTAQVIGGWSVSDSTCHKETFQGMTIVPSSQPGVTISENPYMAFPTEYGWVGK